MLGLARPGRSHSNLISWDPKLEIMGLGLIGDERFPHVRIKASSDRIVDEGRALIYIYIYILLLILLLLYYILYIIDTLYYMLCIIYYIYIYIAG
jgi:hypothetical protein